MEDIRSQIQVNLDEIRQLTNMDFAALAFSYVKQQIIRWNYASGNRNERYRRIVLRLGKGIAGKIMLSGRPIQLHSEPPGSGDDPREYPILLAENLKSALGVPVMAQGQIRGVLLIGSRTYVEFGLDTLEKVTDFAERFGPMIERIGEDPADVLSSVFYKNIQG